MVDPINSNPQDSQVSGAHLPKDKNPEQSLDPILLAYFCLVNATNTASRTAVIKSKELQQSGNAQLALNKELANIGWYQVPTVRKTKVTKGMVSTWKWTLPLVGNHPIRYKAYKKVYTMVVANGTVRTAAQMKNQQADAERTHIIQNLNMLQQGAQIDETKVSTITNEAVQTMQQASGLVDMLQMLTFKVLMRQQPG